jgi:hypothetical protein
MRKEAEEYGWRGRRGGWATRRGDGAEQRKESVCHLVFGRGGTLGLEKQGHPMPLGGLLALGLEKITQIAFVVMVGTDVVVGKIQYYIQYY